MARRSRKVSPELKLSLVTSPSHRVLMPDGALTRRQARRLSRRFGHVGVAIPAMRRAQEIRNCRTSISRLPPRSLSARSALRNLSAANVEPCTV
jgi:hypothetical protein